MGNTICDVANYGYVESTNTMRIAGTIGNPMWNDKVHRIANFGMLSNENFLVALAMPTRQISERWCTTNRLLVLRFPYQHRKETLPTCWGKGRRKHLAATGYMPKICCPDRR